MTEQNEKQPGPPPPNDTEHGVKVSIGRRKQVDPPKPRPLPPWKVLLHNDDVNEVLFVVETIVELTPLSQPAATQRVIEAHHSGVSLLLTTHLERAELYKDQFTSKGLTVTIEAGEA